MNGCLSVEQTGRKVRSQAETRETERAKIESFILDWKVL